VSTNPAANAAITDSADNAKRRQIMAGARELFLAQGFDAASMGEIARTAGVSKGYVYFDSKEQLFDAIATEQCNGLAERVFSLDPEDRDVEAVLTRLGCAICGLLIRPEAMPAAHRDRHCRAHARDRA
jgi:AcrR family transcriptional regulator